MLWSTLTARLFGAPPSACLTMPQQLLDGVGAQIDRLDVALVAVPLMLLAAVATHLSARLSAAQQDPDGPAAAAALRWLPWIMPLGVLAGGLLFPFPLTILLYCLTRSIWTLAQQRVVFGTVKAKPPP